MNRPLRVLVALALLALLTACGDMGEKRKLDPLEKMLTAYSAAIRWSEFDKAVAFVDPKVRADRPLTDLERERYKLIQVTSYEVKRKGLTAEGKFEQVVEIRLISKNTMRERMITDHQLWTYDETTKQFWLTSGLPDFTAQ